VYDASRITPGYWFVAPYTYLEQQPQPEHYYQACQTGPAIYDSTGVSESACTTRMGNVNVSL
jgi:hypothetical protein